ncbi:MAG: tetratricopeptide repeat protein [Candidatus Omnitrophota bacterium]
MKNIKIFVVAIFILFSVKNIFAEVVTLKSGKVMEAQILEKNKDYTRIKYNGMPIYYENKYIKSIQGALEDNSFLAKEGSSSISSYFEGGLKLAAEGKFDEAEQVFIKELADLNGALSLIDELKKGSINQECATYLFQGYFYMVQEQYSKAIEALEKAWEVNPKDPDVNYNLGVCYFFLQRYEKAEAYLLGSLAARPEDIQAYGLIARSYYNRGQNQKAKECLRIAIELLKKDGNAGALAEVNDFLQTIP